MQRDVRIDSYFSLPTDLVNLFSSWPEFVSGSGHNIDFRNNVEQVQVREHDDDGRYIRVQGKGEGPLFHRVLGVIAHALAQNSGNVMLMQWGDES